MTATILQRPPAEAVDRRLARWATVLCALAIVLDGFDNQLLGIAIPTLIAEWHVSRDAFVPVIAASLLAMSAGTAAAGLVGDRIGRRPALVASVTLFGAATLASAAAPDLATFGILRAVAALGLGGAMPNATALLAEFAPARRRSLIVTVGIICVPIGGVLGGVLAGQVLPALGWRALMLIGGGLPLASAVVMLLLLPESPGFQRGVADDGQVATAGRSGALSTILAPGLRRDTIALWAAFFFCLLAVYAVFSWVPTMLAQAGYGVAVASNGLAAFNFGGIFGALAGAAVMDRRGSRAPMAVASAGGVVLSALCAWIVTSASAGPVLVITALAAQGVFLTALQIMLFALAAGVYADASRATGVGAALAIGRLGAVVSALAGAAALSFGRGSFMLLIALSIGLSGVAVLALRRHLPGSAGR